MKYIGSKNRIAKELVPIIQSYITEDTVGYLEPFVGEYGMFKSCEDCKYEKGCKFKKHYQEVLKQSKEQQKGYDGTELPFYSKVYCKEFYAKPCRFEYECEGCGLTE